MAVKFGTAAIMSIYGFISDSFDAITPVSLQDLGFTLTQLKGADVALISIGDAIRWKADDPDIAGYIAVTSAVGFPEDADTKFEIWGYPNLINLRMIAVTGTCAVTVSLGRFGAAVES